MNNLPPLTDAIIVALAKLVDDAQLEKKRAPTHYDVTSEIEKAGLKAADPGNQGRAIGKSKRVRAVLNFSLANDYTPGAKLVGNLIASVRACGGFRPTSENYCGIEAIENLISAFDAEGWQLGKDGTLGPRVLDSLTGRALTPALVSYAERARRGALDGPLLTGTAKDLLEATAAHAVTTLWGSYSPTTPFPTLLGQAFTALGLATPNDPIVEAELPIKNVQRAAYGMACAINSLRNRVGTGHGRPWIASITQSQSKFAIESMGNIASMMLEELVRRGY